MSLGRLNIVTCLQNSSFTSAPQRSVPVVTAEMWNAAVCRCLYATQMLSIMQVIWLQSELTLIRILVPHRHCFKCKLELLFVMLFCFVYQRSLTFILLKRLSMAYIVDGGKSNAIFFFFTHFCPEITLTPETFSSSTLALLNVFSQTVDRAAMAPAPRVRGLALNWKLFQGPMSRMRPALSRK